MAGPGRPKTGGRAKGTPNKNTTEIKDAIVAALNSGEGAEAYFRGLKDERPDLFVSLVGKILPKDVNLAAEANVTITIERDFVRKCP